MEALKLILTALLAVALAVLLYFADKKTAFGRLDPVVKQVITGVAFGMAAVFATHFSAAITYEQVPINARNGVVLASGLIFGPLSGILSGIIGGVERVLATELWGIGAYTQIACCVSTVFTGFVSALSRTAIFSGKRPSIFYTLIVGAFAEAFHILMIFLTHMGDLEVATRVVEAVAGKLILTNVVTVTLVTAVVEIIDKRKLFVFANIRLLPNLVQTCLVISAAILLTATVSLNYAVQYEIAESRTKNLLLDNLGDYVSEVGAETDPEALASYAGYWRVGEQGILIVCNQNYDVLNGAFFGSKVDLSDVIDSYGENEIFSHKVFDDDCRCMYTKIGETYIIAMLPDSETFFYCNASLHITIYIEIIIISAFLAATLILDKKLVIDNIERVNDMLSQITSGNLDARADASGSIEFERLSSDINTTVDTLKGYIAREAARIDAELEFARSIQHSALPSVFPPYPNRRDFDIFARMDAAKEVGGDFYDFYFVGENKFAFLIADVSGKGIPAAMLMMRAKTVIKSLAESGIPPAEVLAKANAELCENNDAGMFVTAWLGVIELSSGNVNYANAGHNPPVLVRDGKPEYIKMPPGLVLGAMEGVKYTEGSCVLSPGDKIFLYTDGVTEAIDGDSALYGEARLIKCLESYSGAGAQTLCSCVFADVNRFATGTVQFDDITMLALYYNGRKGIAKRELAVTANIDNIPLVTQFINSELKLCGASKKSVNSIDIALDEIFSNICKYAYGDDGGEVYVSISVAGEPATATITIVDSGREYDVFSAPEPDISASAEDREYGGLGVLVVKKLMDSANYMHSDGKNVVTITKTI